MCTITLTYDPDNVIAQQSLAALLATGQFITGDATHERLAVMQRAHARAMQKESYTPEEAYHLIMKEIKAVYDRTPGI